MSRGIRWTRAAMLGVTLAMLRAQPLLSQSTGTISGRVSDADNGQNIVAAQIVVDGGALARATGDDGRYSIVGVSAGTHTIVVRRIGYQQQTRTVTVTSGGTTTADFGIL